MKLTLHLSRWAEEDLSRIAEYTLQMWGERQLLKYQALLEHGLSAITRDPLAPRSKERNELFLGCRSIHIGRHVVLYRVKESHLEVARVLHDSMELERHIPSDLITPED